MTDTIPIPRELRAQLMAELGFVVEPYGAAGPVMVEESLAGEVTRDATLAEAVLWKLVLEARRSTLTQQAEPVRWRCFHCNECFTDQVAATEHFGKSEYQQPACLIDIAEYRRMEEVNRRHCEEDTDLHRAVYAAQHDGNEKARRAEELGYARGLRDSGKCPCAQAPATPPPPSPSAEPATRKLLAQQDPVTGSIVGYFSDEPKPFPDAQPSGEVLTEEDIDAVSTPAIRWLGREGGDAVVYEFARAVERATLAKIGARHG